MPTYRPLNVGLQQSEALADTYLGSPADDPVLMTIELHNPGFSQPLRFVDDWSALQATLEDDAPQNAGEEVTFDGVPFDFVRPAETDNGAPAPVQLVIDNLNSEVTRRVLEVQASEEPVLAILRVYLPSDTTAPHELPVTRLYVSSPVVMDGFQARLTCSFGDLTTRKFPRLEYRRETHPALSVG